MASLGGLSMGLSLSAARAEFPDVSVFENAVELDDSELAEMRGKFVSPGRMTYFGVVMDTHWRTGSGEVLFASMKMDMNFPNGNNVKPVVNLIPKVSIGDASQTAQAQDNSLFPSDVTVDASISSNGLINVNGVAQSIQIAGNENMVSNNTEMEITIRSSNNAGIVPAGINIAPNSAQKTSASGSVVFSGAKEGMIQVFAKVPNQGEIIQRIGGMNNEGNILQSVRVIGDQHSIINTMIIKSNFNASVSRSVLTNSFFSAMRGI